MDAGCQHCEERFLEVAVAHGLCPPPAQRMSLAQVGCRRRCCRRGAPSWQLSKQVKGSSLFLAGRAVPWASVKLCSPHANPVALTPSPARLQVLRANLELPRCVLGSQAVPDYVAAAAALQRFTRRQELRWAGAEPGRLR